MKFVKLRFTFLQVDKHLNCKFLASACIGTLFGCCFSAIFKDDYLVLMRRAVSLPVSIVGTLMAVVVPYVAIVYSTRLWLIYAQICLRFFFVAASFYIVGEAFGSAAWLIRCLLLFPDYLCMPVVFHFVCRSRRNKRKQTVLLIYSLLIGWINYQLISPFLAAIIQKFETTGRYAIHAELGWCL